MNKKSIGIIAMLALALAVVTACAPPAPNQTTTNPPVTNVPGAPGAISPSVNAPEGGAGVAPSVPGIAPAPPSRGAVDGIGITTPAAMSPAMAVSAGGYTSPSPILNQYQNQNSGIVVTGQGQIEAVPDIAYLSLGVSSQALTVAQAQSDAANAMTAVMKVLKDKGIADADITTTGFNINPVYDYRTNTPVITGYQVTNMITVKIRKIADTSAVIDSSVTAGGNFIRVNSVSFGVNDPTPYIKQARAKAMANAIDTAGQLAILGGVTLGKPVYITESSGYYPPSPIYYGAEASAKDVATPISPGQTQINVSVTVIYAIQ